MRKNKLLTIFAVLVFAFLIIPLIIITVTAFGGGNAITFPIESFSMKWFLNVFSLKSFRKSFLTSLEIAFLATFIALLVGIPAAYALARWNSVWADVLTLLFLSSMFVPFHTIMISLLTTAKGMHLTGHIYGLILIYCGLQCPIPIFLIKGFVDGVPKELEEAAMIDGCGTVRLFFSVVLPMLKPILATVAVLNALWIWNDFLLPYLILAKPVTIPLSQMYFYGQYNQQWNLIMAGFVVSTIPVVLFFLLMQKHIINGIAAGAVKG